MDAGALEVGYSPSFPGWNVGLLFLLHCRAGRWQHDLFQGGGVGLCRHGGCSVFMHVHGACAELHDRDETFFLIL